MSHRLRRVAIGALALVLVAALALWVAIAPPVAPVPEQGARLEGVTIVEPGRFRIAGRTVVVEGDRIARIEPAVDPHGPALGGFVLPGLIDLHVHHPSPWTPGERDLFSLLFLYHGVTAVRDTGSLLGSLEPHRQRIATGRRAGPRVFRCGPVVDGVPASWPGARSIAGAEAARAVVGELVADGVDCIKAYNYLDRPTLEALGVAARDAGLPLVGHMPFDVGFRAAKSMEVQHLMGLTDDWSSVHPAQVGRYVAHSREAGLTHTPTLFAFDQSGRLDRMEELRRDPTLRWLPRYYAAALWDPAHNPLVYLQSPQASEDARRRYETMKQAVAEMRDAGVPLHVGSDTMNAFVVPGAGLHGELRAWVDAGFDVESVWAAATAEAGEVLGVRALGRLEPGAPADLLLFREDPTRNLAALDTLELVVAGGRVYRREDLFRELERQRAHFRGLAYDTVTMQVARRLAALMERLTP